MITQLLIVFSLKVLTLATVPNSGENVELVQTALGARYSEADPMSQLIKKAQEAHLIKKADEAFAKAPGETADADAALAQGKAKESGDAGAIEDDDDYYTFNRRVAPRNGARLKHKGEAEAEVPRQKKHHSRRIATAIEEQKAAEARTAGSRGKVKQQAIEAAGGRGRLKQTQAKTRAAVQKQQATETSAAEHAHARRGKGKGKGSSQDESTESLIRRTIRAKEENDFAWDPRAGISRQDYSEHGKVVDFK